METLIANMAKAFVKAFGAALLVVLIGITKQPSLHGAVGIGIAGLMGAIAMGLAAIQTFIPEISLAPYIPPPYGSIIDSFIRAFLGAFLVALIGILNEPSLSGWSAALVAAIVGAINAGLQAIQGTLTLGQLPLINYGMPAPTRRASAARYPKAA